MKLIENPRTPRPRILQVFSTINKAAGDKHQGQPGTPQGTCILRVNPKCGYEDDELLHRILVHAIHPFEFLVPRCCRPFDPMLDAHSTHLDTEKHVLRQHEKRDNDSCFHSFPLLLI